MYYCSVHQVAYENPRQFQGHWLHAHPGEPRPVTESVFIEQVPEGTKIAAPAKERRAARPPLPPPGSVGRADAPASGSVTTAERPVPGAYIPAYADEEEIHLDQLLDSIGAPLAQRQTIVKGWRMFPVLHQHPGNLETHIIDILGQKFRGKAQLVVHAMFPGAEQEAPPTQYMYGAPSYGRPGPMYWPEQARWPGSQRSWERPPDGYYESRYRPPIPGTAEDGDASPQLVALQKEVSGIVEVLKGERAERAQEKQERLEKERDAAWQSQLAALTTKVDNSFTAMTDMVKGLADQLHQGRTTVEASHTQELVETVSELKDTIANNRAAQLQGTVDSLRTELLEINQKVNREPTGKTTEDLIATAIPVLGAKIDDLGEAVKGELKGIRLQAADGKLPNVSGPNPSTLAKQREAANPTETAQQIIGARGLEDEILKLAGASSRS